MPPLLDSFVKAFIPLLVAIDPIGLAVVFLVMRGPMILSQQRRIARQATLTGGGVALIFLFLGTLIFELLGIAVRDFQIAGGLILFIIAARELTLGPGEAPATLGEDFGVVPLGMPLIAGPASITTLIVLNQTMGWGITLVALAANLVLVVLAFAYCDALARRVGTTGLKAISKIVALLLAAIAVSMIRHGLNP